jgi:hypothetical protein
VLWPPGASGTALHPGAQKPVLRPGHRRFSVLPCPSEFPQVIKFHGALPDGIFTHFQVHQGLSETQAKHSYLKIILRSLINRMIHNP